MPFPASASACRWSRFIAPALVEPEEVEPEVLWVMPLTAALLAVPTRFAIRPLTHEVSRFHIDAMPLMMP